MQSISTNVQFPKWVVTIQTYIHEHQINSVAVQSNVICIHTQESYTEYENKIVEMFTLWHSIHTILKISMLVMLYLAELRECFRKWSWRHWSVFTWSTLLTLFSGFNLAGVYFQSIMIMCTLSVIMSVMVLNFHHRKPEQYVMPTWVCN